MVSCPKCKVQMQKREGQGHYGAKLPLFQCPGCSGLWVDGRVVRGMSYDSALEAEPDAVLDEIVTEPRKTEMACPRCESKLMEQAGGSLPKDLHIDYCSVCEGYWFDKGELMIYKSHLEKRRQALKADHDESRRKQERAGWAAPKKVEPRSFRHGGSRIAMGLARDLTRFLSS